MQLANTKFRLGSLIIFTFCSILSVYGQMNGKQIRSSNLHQLITGFSYNTEEPQYIEDVWVGTPGRKLISTTTYKIQQRINFLLGYRRVLESHNIFYELSIRQLNWAKDQADVVVTDLEDPDYINFPADGWDSNTFYLLTRAEIGKLWYSNDQFWGLGLSLAISPYYNFIKSYPQSSIQSPFRIQNIGNWFQQISNVHWIN